MAQLHGGLPPRRHVRWHWALIGMGALAWSVPATAQTSSASASSGSAATMGQIMPIPVPMFIGGSGGGMMGGNSSGLSPTDAAALGPGYGLPRSSSMFNNPMAAPFLYGSMFPLQTGGTSSTSSTSAYGGLMNGLSTNQLGLLMLANQAQMTGIGSGQISGVRPVPGGLPGRGNPRAVAVNSRKNPSQPLGVAGHYFNRTIPEKKMTHTQVHYNRQNRYFPQTPH